VVRRSRPDTGGLASVMTFILVVVVAMLGVVFATSKGMISGIARARAEVTTTYTPAKVIGNSLVIDFEAAVIHGPVEMQVYVAGPSLKPMEILNSLDLLNEDFDVVHPGAQSSAPLRIGTNGLNRWQTAVVLPNSMVAERARKNLQPIGLLDPRPDRGVAGEIFNIHGPAGGNYTGYFVVGPIGQQEKLRRPFPSAAHIGRKDHSVHVTHDDVSVHYLFYYAGDFNTTSSGTHNSKTGDWIDDGSVQLSNERNFGFDRRKLYPDELRVNGTRYDLRKGRVFVLNDDGTLEQLALELPLPLAMVPAVVGELIDRQNADPEEP
ncbi:MAG: hypothetical protein ACPGVU_07060, partial [Limisphaerales bacterium]